MLTAYERPREEEEEEDEYTARIQAQEIDIREELGPLGKLHNIVVYIRSSPQRTAEFVSLAERRIPLDNRTR